MRVPSPGQQQIRGLRAVCVLAVAGALAVSLAGCSAGGVPSAPASPTTTALTTTTTVPSTTSGASAGTTQSNIAYNTNASASYAVGPQPANWDIHSAGASPWYLTLQQVLAQVWPSAFYVGTNEVNSSWRVSLRTVSVLLSSERNSARRPRTARTAHNASAAPTAASSTHIRSMA